VAYKKAAFAVVVLVMVFSSCGKPVEEKGVESPHFTSFRDIPGVTDNEIQAIEALQEQHTAFVYGMMPSTETFLIRDGELGGYSVLFCEWLSQLFEIPFKPALYEWGDLLAGLQSGEVDFTGEITASDERRQTYFMTDAIAERSIRTLRLKDSRPLSEIARQHPLRYGVFSGATTFDIVSHLPDECEITLFDDYDTVYRKLKSGEIDVFCNENSAGLAFDIFGDVIAGDFFPLVYTSVSLATRKKELAPLIAVVQKALENGSVRYLTELYNRGNGDYVKNKLLARLTDAERA
jgi:ABC-type amino acid transport substrate-binding protein